MESKNKKEQQRLGGAMPSYFVDRWQTKQHQQQNMGWGVGIWDQGNEEMQDEASKIALRKQNNI